MDEGVSWMRRGGEKEEEKEEEKWIVGCGRVE